MMNLDQFSWMNPPKEYDIHDGQLTLMTDPQTDFWQRTYYGFRNDNGHAFVASTIESFFSFAVKVAWETNHLYDQAGIILYQDPDNWFKASVEYENEQISRLGSVVTNHGYSDWATTDINTNIGSMHYLLSRRGQDFLIQNAQDGKNFHQMRLFHMHEPLTMFRIGVYACSPLDSTFKANFSEFQFGQCLWQAHN